MVILTILDYLTINIINLYCSARRLQCRDRTSLEGSSAARADIHPSEFTSRSIYPTTCQTFDWLPVAGIYPRVPRGISLWRYRARLADRRPGLAAIQDSAENDWRPISQERIHSRGRPETGWSSGFRTCIARRSDNPEKLVRRSVLFLLRENGAPCPSSGPLEFHHTKRE